MTDARKQIAIIPDLPRDNKIIDQKGEFTPYWSFFLQHLIMALQTNFKPEGFVIPAKTATEIARLISQASAHNVIYDSTNNAMEANITNTTSSAQNWTQLATIQSHAGNPNGAVAGNTLQLCWDSTNSVLYICSSGGSAAGSPAPQAVWTAV